MKVYKLKRNGIYIYIGRYFQEDYIIKSAVVPKLNWYKFKSELIFPLPFQMIEKLRPFICTQNNDHQPKPFVTKQLTKALWHT